MGSRKCNVKHKKAKSKYFQHPRFINSDVNLENQCNFGKQKCNVSLKSLVDVTNSMTLFCSYLC